MLVLSRTSLLRSNRNEGGGRFVCRVTKVASISVLQFTNTWRSRLDQRYVAFHESDGFLCLESLVQMSLVLTLYRSTVRQYGHEE